MVKIIINYYEVISQYRKDISVSKFPLYVICKSLPLLSIPVQYSGFKIVPLSPQEKAMATRSSVLAWRIPGMGESGGLLSMGLHRVGHD